MFLFRKSKKPSSRVTTTTTPVPLPSIAPSPRNGAVRATSFASAVSEEVELNFDLQIARAEAEAAAEEAVLRRSARPEAVRPVAGMGRRASSMFGGEKSGARGGGGGVVRNRSSVFEELEREYARTCHSGHCRKESGSLKNLHEEP